jgi:hypothetical protein
MDPSKNEVGSPGFTDHLHARIDKIALLLSAQHTKARSKRMLLSLFQAFARVKKERSVYQVQVPSVTKTRTLAWADGYLASTADAINLYLQKRWSLTPLAFEECELIVEDPAISQLLEHGTRTAESDPNPDADAGGGAALSIAETREGAAAN